MREESQPGQRGVDVNTPSVARMYDYALDGKDNYAVDRRAVAELSESSPSAKALAINNRRFLQRAVRALAGQYGVRQFLDHGSGLPTQDNVHQIAQRVDPSSRVVYVDNDPIVLSHGRALLQENENTTVVTADMRDTAGILAHPEVKSLLRLDEPFAALFVSVLHCIPDSSDPAALVRKVVDLMPSGSYIVISHLVSDDRENREDLTEFMLRATDGNWGRVRETSEVDRYFDGLEVLDPGIGKINDWRPDSDLALKQLTEEWYEYGGVARKP